MIMQTFLCIFLPLLPYIAFALPQITPKSTESLSLNISHSNSLFEDSIDAGFKAIAGLTNQRQVWMIKATPTWRFGQQASDFRNIELAAYDPDGQRLIYTHCSGDTPFQWSDPTIAPIPPEIDLYKWQWDDQSFELRETINRIRRATHEELFDQVRLLWPTRDPFTRTVDSEVFVGLHQYRSSGKGAWSLLGLKTGRIGTVASFGDDSAVVMVQHSNVTVASA